ncbi:MAG: hypothetical protein IJM57_09565, partial [Lachnospiraceae bacterium]|nr:hypothetical protein [Lachnospiraceae bacterium]MBQ6661649.1 hypothetical protein [Lachnospiraceae bacterium]
AVAGSVKITVKRDFLKAQTTGNHEVTVQFVDGSAKTTFAIDRSEPEPPTGDSTQMTLWIVLALLALLMAGTVMWQMSRRREED